MISIQKRIIQIIFFCLVLPVFSEASEHENAEIYSGIDQTTEYGEGQPIRIDRSQDIIR